MSGFRILFTDWARDRDRLSSIRRTVFIDEQQVPEELEWDADDAGALHALAIDGQDRPIGCARLLPDGHIGRMAVLPAWRGRGVGRALLDAVMGEADARGYAMLRLSAQTHAADFYARCGFEAVGAVYEEAGIPHVAMQKPLH